MITARGIGRLTALGVLIAAAVASTLAACAGAPAPVTPVLPPAASVPAQAPTQPSPAANQPGQQRQPPAVPTSPAADLVTRGKALYGAGCAGCHGQQGAGSGRGPSLIGVGAASTDFQLSSGRMPLSQTQPQPTRQPPAYSRDDIDALVAYVSSLGPGGIPIPQLPPGDVTRGRDLYLLNCASCHASTGVGAALPAGQVAPPLLDVPASQVAEAVRVGPGLMPQFPAGTLSDQQTADIVAYVTQLPSTSDHGGWAIGAVGPVTEGLIGWILGLGVLLAVIRLLGKKAPR
jgi:ubiquinol-cytochrome c reductase cytochrome c subunit